MWSYNPRCLSLEWLYILSIAYLTNTHSYDMDTPRSYDAGRVGVSLSTRPGYGRI